MSLFPPRLIDELGDGDARHMLEEAAEESAPRGRVLAALERATSVAASSAPSAVLGRHRSTILGVLAGIVFLGASVSVGLSVTQEEPRSLAPALPTLQAKATETLTPSPPPSGGSVPTASVEDLPSAVVPKTAAPPPQPPQTAPPTAEGARAQKSGDLLREANRLRAQSLWSEAAARYRLLLDRSPHSIEAYPALVALGDVELVQGHATEALATYDRALSSFPNGNLDEEARWGRARSLRALGRTTDERAALEDFCAHHPDTPLARIAAARLEHLGQ